MNINDTVYFRLNFTDLEKLIPLMNKNQQASLRYILYFGRIIRWRESDHPKCLSAPNIFKMQLHDFMFVFGSFFEFPQKYTSPIVHNEIFLNVEECSAYFSQLDENEK